MLHDAAQAGDAGAYRSLASKLYPGLFVEVAEMAPGDLSTDLSTAVFLAEKLARVWSAAGAATADCRNERPDIYLPLCTALRGGTVRQLLLAKSRLHARWGEAALSDCKGEADSETASTLAEMRAARANDILIVAKVLEALRPLEVLTRPSGTGHWRAQGFDAPQARPGGNEAEFADALRDAGALLAWMPRSPAFYHLSAARLAYADGLLWHGRALRSGRLVVSAKEFEPDPLKDLRLNVGQAAAAAEANWKSAARHARLAERFLSQQTR